MVVVWAMNDRSIDPMMHRHQSVAPIRCVDCSPVDIQKH
jgi:hypothetical protein